MACVAQHTSNIRSTDRLCILILANSSNIPHTAIKSYFAIKH